MCHIRFRKGWKVQAHTLEELALKSQATIYEPYVVFGFNGLILITQFWLGFAPVRYADITAAERVQNFFQEYLAFGLVVVSIVVYKVVYKTKFKRAHEMDVTTGVEEGDGPGGFARTGKG
jgi:amino acid transporter